MQVFENLFSILYILIRSLQAQIGSLQSLLKITLSQVTRAGLLFVTCCFVLELVQPLGLGGLGASLALEFNLRKTVSELLFELIGRIFFRLVLLGYDNLLTAVAAKRPLKRDIFLQAHGLLPAHELG